MMSLAFIGDVLSYELAVSRGVDPFSVENIDIIKKGLEESLNFAQKLEKKLGIS